jgi:hypothetical protein
MGRSKVYNYGLARRESAFTLKFLGPDTIRGRTRDVGYIDDGNFRLAYGHGGRMSSASTNLSSLPNANCGICGRTWGTCSHSGMDFDDAAMQMICAKAGESTSMTDPYLLLKFRGPRGNKHALAYA